MRKDLISKQQDIQFINHNHQLNSMLRQQQNPSIYNQSHSHINQHRNNSEPVNYYSTSKNGRSSSLPLKIMINQQKSAANANADKLIKSWNGSSSVLQKKFESSNQQQQRIYLYAHLSVSDYYINLIGQDIANICNFNKSVNSKNNNNNNNNTNNNNQIVSKSDTQCNNNNNNNNNNIYSEHVLDYDANSNLSNCNNIHNNNNHHHVSSSDNKFDKNNILNISSDESSTDSNENLYESSSSRDSNEAVHFQLEEDLELENESNKLDDQFELNNNNNVKIYNDKNNNLTDEKNLNNQENKLEETKPIDEQQDQLVEKQENKVVESVPLNDDESETDSSLSSSPLSIKEDEELICGDYKLESLSSSSASFNENDLTITLENETTNKPESESSPIPSTCISSSSSLLTNNLTNNNTNEVSTNTTNSGDSSGYNSIDEENSANKTQDETFSSSSADLSMQNSSLSSLSINVTLDETCRNLEENDVLISSSSDDDIFKDFMPKKSCLKKLFIDTSNTTNVDLDSANATSSPLYPITPTSPTFSLSSSNSSSLTTQNSTISSPTQTSVKKRVSFADNNGKDLFTVRTMSEPSNCPPKLTSKIVEYFLNREFNNSNSNLNGLAVNGSGQFQRTNSNEFSNFNNAYPHHQSKDSSTAFFSSSRSYDYGISALNYTNDVNDLTGSIAVYSLNFAQPAGDYLNFRKRLDDSFVSLENVLLNRFQINGTIKVKNINFHKQVFVRCSFNGWSSYEDYYAQYVPCEYFSTSVNMSSPTSSSFSATFYGSNNALYQPHHKDYDTFRFEFQLPKTVDQNGKSKENQNDKNSPNASIQFCICFRTGQGHETKEFWDNNSGLNYEVLQYVIDIENLKPSSKQQQQLRTSQYLKNKQQSSYFKYDSNTISKSNYLLQQNQQNQCTGVYY